MVMQLRFEKVFLTQLQRFANQLSLKVPPTVMKAEEVLAFKTNAFWQTRIGWLTSTSTKGSWHCRYLSLVVPPIAQTWLRDPVSDVYIEAVAWANQQTVTLMASKPLSSTLL